MADNIDTAALITGLRQVVKDYVDLEEYPSLTVDDAVEMWNGSAAYNLAQAIIGVLDNPPVHRRVDDPTTFLADGRQVPTAAVKALDALDEQWPGATLPQARPAIVAAVLDWLAEED